MEPLLVIVGIAVLAPVLFVIIQFNQLVGLRNYIRNAWGNIDTELQRRYELIPNLVATVQGYAAHERQVLQSVTTLRARCVANQGSPETQAADERQLVAALQQLWAVAENYPDLKANQHFLQLQRELVNTEDRIQAARRFYNGNVRDYQTKCQSFPSNLVAQLFGFKPAEYFTVSPSVREVPDVEFNSP
jgi:LemA protein